MRKSTCGVCNKEFTYKRAMLSHKRRVHGGYFQSDPRTTLGVSSSSVKEERLRIKSMVHELKSSWERVGAKQAVVALDELEYRLTQLGDDS